MVSTDTLVEGADFRQDWSGGRDVGVKLAAQNFADIAAMGARPVALVVSLAAPPRCAWTGRPPSRTGSTTRPRGPGPPWRAGTCRSPRSSCSPGRRWASLEGPPVLRSGARPGDVVALAGRTGPSAAGLALLLATGSRAAAADLAPSASALVQAHLAPRPGYPAGPDAAGAGATALIDVSDGLLRDAGRVARGSASSSTWTRPRSHRRATSSTPRGAG